MQSKGLPGSEPMKLGYMKRMARRADSNSRTNDGDDDYNTIHIL